MLFITEIKLTNKRFSVFRLGICLILSLHFIKAFLYRNFCEMECFIQNNFHSFNFLLLHLWVLVQVFFTMKVLLVMFYTVYINISLPLTFCLDSIISYNSIKISCNKCIEYKHMHIHILHIYI